MDRREWLKAAGVLALGAGCRTAEPGLARVRVSAERVIRTTVGLRPFRPSGFRVEEESFDCFPNRICTNDGGIRCAFHFDRFKRIKYPLVCCKFFHLVPLTLSFL